MPPTEESNDLVIMGRVVAPYGVLGWVKIHPDTEYIDSLFDYETWWLGKEGQWQSYQIEAAKVHNDVLVVKFKGVGDRDAAFALKGKLVSVPRSEFPETDEDEYYWSDLIGLAVKNQQDVDFGKVTDVFETGANDVLVVKGDKERLIPFTNQTVLNVDLSAKTMLVDWEADWDA